MSGATRWLNTIPVGIDKSTGTANRWNNTQPVSPIEKVPWNLVIPSITQAEVSGSLPPTISYNTAYQCCQFNYTAPSSFTIVTLSDGPLNYYPLMLVIRYRVGTVNTRYNLSTGYFSIAGGPNIPQPYKGQLILPQFSIEGYIVEGKYTPWTTEFPGYNLRTSLLTTPPQPLYGQQPISLVPSGGIVTSDLYTTPNMNLPFNWPSDCLWNSN
jgi:hypothetical protein